MTKHKVTVSDFKRDPVRHVVIPLLIEFLSQFMMTFWGVMTEEPQSVPNVDIVASNNTVTASSAKEKDYMTHTFVPALQSGISVWVCITLFSKMSYAPAQFNPSITVTLVVVGTVPVLMLIPNIIVQCLASLLASFVSQAIRGVPPPALIIPEEISTWSIAMSEVILVASFTVMAAELTQNPKMSDPLGAFAFGMVVFMSILSGKWIGVVCINPSRVFGPVVLTGGAAWNRHWLLWLTDAVGSVSAGLFWLLFLAPLDRSWLGRFTKEETQMKRKKKIKKGILIMETKNEMESDG